MHDFTTTELDRMQSTQESAMMCTCTVGAYSSTPDSYGNPSPSYAYGTAIACGVQHIGPKEEQASGEVPVINAKLRLPIDTVLDERDRIKVTHRFGAAPSTAQVFEIEGPPRRGPSGLVVDVRVVDDGTG